MTKSVETSTDDSNLSDQSSSKKSLNRLLNNNEPKETILKLTSSSGDSSSMGVSRLVNYSSTSSSTTNTDKENLDLMQPTSNENSKHENFNIYSQLYSLSDKSTQKIKIEHVFFNDNYSANKKGSSDNKMPIYKNLDDEQQGSFYSSNESLNELYSSSSSSNLSSVNSSSSSFLSSTSLNKEEENNMNKLNKKILDVVMNGFGERLFCGFQDGWKVKETLIKTRGNCDSDNFTKFYGLEAAGAQLLSNSALSYSSSSSSNLSTLSEQLNSESNVNQKNNKKPISLSYYHHIFNQKQKSNALLPLYKFTNRSAMILKPKRKQQVKELRTCRKNTRNCKSLTNGMNKSLSTISEEMTSLSGQFSNKVKRRETGFLSCSPIRVPNNELDLNKKVKEATKIQNKLNISVNKIDEKNLADITKSSIVNRPLNMSIDTSKSGGGKVTADVKLNEQTVKFDLKRVSNTKHEIRLIPSKMGLYQIHIYLNGVAVRGSPYTLRIDDKQYDEIINLRCELISMTPTGHLRVGHEVCLNVAFVDENSEDKLKLCDSMIEAKVKLNNLTPVEHNLDSAPDKTCRLCFTPTQSGYYYIAFFNNGQKIDGASFKINIPDANKQILKPNVALVGKPYLMNIECEDSDKLDIQMKKSHLSQNVKFETIIESKKSSVLKFTPLEPVEHLISINQDGVRLKEFPVKLNVYPGNGSFLFNENPNGIRLGDSANVSLRTNQRKESLLIRITRVDASIGRSVSFLLGAEYLKVQHIFGALCKFLRTNLNNFKSPELSVENGRTRVKFIVADEAVSKPSLLRELNEIINLDKFLIIDLKLNKEIRAVKNSLRFGSKGESLAYKLEKLNDDNFKIEFKPNKVGKYKVEVEEGSGEVVQGSSMFLNVYDPSQLKIISTPDKLIVASENFIEIDSSLAGDAKLEAWLQDSSENRERVKIFDEITKRIRLVPQQVGKHKLFIKLGDHFVKDAIELEAVENDLGQVEGEGVFSAVQNTPAQFRIKTKSEKVRVEIKTPSRKELECKVEPKSDYFDVSYVANECGLHLVTVRCDGKELEPSPFQLCVTNPFKVRLISDVPRPKILQLIHNQQKEIIFDTSNAGPGNLRCEIRDQNFESIPFSKSINENYQKIIFTPPYEGEFKISLSWNDYALPELTGRTLKYSLVSECKLHGESLSRTKCGKWSEFIIDASKSLKLIKLEPLLLFSNNANQLVQVKHEIYEISKNVFKCSYMIETPGIYLLSISINGVQLIDSPFEIQVAPNSDATKVKFSKENFKHGVLGEELMGLIETSDAGSGELCASCIGPHKNALCEFEDRNNGVFLLKIKPQEVGKHYLHLKYNGDYLFECPLEVRISKPPDASKVKVYGPGISHGVLGQFLSTFTCDTKGAGSGQLVVRIKGPKGAFKVDMNRKSERDRKITCKFDPLEAGDYQINIKWSGKHVPNSPFNVKIFKTKDELNQFLEKTQLNNEPAENQKIKHVQF